MKKFIFILILLLSASPVLARDISFRAYYSATGKTYGCSQLYFGVKGTTCYTMVNGKLRSQGVGVLQQFTGIYDSNGIGIYEGDKVFTREIGVGTIVWISSVYNAWYILGADGYILYLFSNLTDYPIARWSTIIQ